MCLGHQRYLSVFKNEQNETVVNIRKGTRSVTISKEYLTHLFELKEILQLCFAFTECADGKHE